MWVPNLHGEMDQNDYCGTTNSAYKAKIDAIENKLIDDLGTSTTDANDLVRGMLQASITRGLSAEMDAHLSYESGDRSAKAAVGTDNHRVLLQSWGSKKSDVK